MTKVTLGAHTPPQPTTAEQEWLQVQGVGCRVLEVYEEDMGAKAKQNKALPTELNAFCLPGLGRLPPWLWVMAPISLISLVPFCDARPLCLSGIWQA